MTEATGEHNECKVDSQTARLYKAEPPLTPPGESD